MSTDPVQDVLNRPPREQTKKEEKRTGAITISNTHVAHVEAWAKVKRLTKREAAEELIAPVRFSSFFVFSSWAVAESCR